MAEERAYRRNLVLPFNEASPIPDSVTVGAAVPSIGTEREDIEVGVEANEVGVGAGVVNSTLSEVDSVHAPFTAESGPRNERKQVGRNERKRDNKVPTKPRKRKGNKSDIVLDKKKKAKGNRKPKKVKGGSKVGQQSKAAEKGGELKEKLGAEE